MKNEKLLDECKTINLNAPMTPIGGIVIVKMNDCDWYAGESVEACVQKCVDESGLPADETTENPHIITAREAVFLKYRDDDQPENMNISFFMELYNMIADKKEFPCFFASTEY